MKDIVFNKVGIIGMWDISKYYIQALYELKKKIEIIGCDIKKMEPNKKIKIVQNYKNKYLKDCDLIIITTPPTKRIEIINYFLKLGKNIVIEKPAVTTRKEYNNLEDLMKHYNKKIYLAYHNLFNPIIDKIWNILKVLKYNKIDIKYWEYIYNYHKNQNKWIFTKDYWGCIRDSVINIISIILFYKDKLSIKKIRVKKRFIDMEDYVNLEMEWENGEQINISYDWFSKKEKGIFEFYKEKDIKLKFDLISNFCFYKWKKILIEKNKKLDMFMEYKKMCLDANNFFIGAKTKIRYKPTLPLQVIFNVLYKLHGE